MPLVSRCQALSAGRYDIRMQPIEIDPELSRLALEEAAQQYPEFAGHALGVIARPLLRGFAWQLEWKWNGTTRASSVGVSKRRYPGIQKAGEMIGVDESLRLKASRRRV